MKVAVVINELNIKGGTHKQVLRLCQYLKKQENVELVLVTRYFDIDKTYVEFSQFDIKFISKNAPEYTVKKRIFPNFKFHIAQVKSDEQLYELIPEDVDIINIHDCGMDRLVKYAKRDGKKVVWQINDLPDYFNVGVACKESDNFKKKIKRLLTKIRTKDVDLITVNVSKNAERVATCLEKDAKVFYCGVDRNDTLQKHSYQGINHQFRLLSMGVFFPYRNYETLVAVIKKLLQEKIDIRLDIMGNTEWDKAYSSKIAKLVEDNGLKENIKIWGQTTDETYSELFNKANAFAFVNIEQSWGLAVFESMSAGLPTIVSNSVGAIELLHHDRDAIIVDPKNVDEICSVIKRIIADSEYYNRISDEAYRVVKEYTWDNLYSSKMLEAFKELENKR